MSEILPPGKDCPVPVTNVAEIELAMVKESPVEDDWKWLNKTAVDIIDQWAPGLLEAIIALSPQAPLNRRITESIDQNIKFAMEKANRLNLNLITTQPRHLYIVASDGSSRKDAFVLSLYLKIDQHKKADLVMLVAANHHLVPDPQPSEIRVIIETPNGIRSLSEERFKELIGYIIEDAKRDMVAKFNKSMRGFGYSMEDRTGLTVSWKLYGDRNELEQLADSFRDFWDNRCKQVLCAMLESDSDNMTLKVDIDKIDAYAFNNRGIECYDKGDYQAAIDLHRKAISLYPEESMFYNNLSGALSMNGKHEEAVASIKLSLKIDPSNKRASKNLTGVIEHAIVKSGREITMHCPFPECEGKISFTLPLLGGHVTARCPICDSGQVIVSRNGVEQIGIFKHNTGDFPHVLGEGIRNDMKAVKDGIWLVDDANVLVKAMDPSLVKEHDCIFDMELYHVRHGLMPVVRLVLVIQDHPKNPSIMNCLCNVARPRVLSELRYLKIVRRINLHVYDSQNQYCFTKEVPVAETPIENTGGPVGAPLRLVEISRTSWHQYVETIIETAKSMCKQLPPEGMDWRQVGLDFNNHPHTCVCELCGRKALTTLSQFHDGGKVDAARLKTSDAIKCTGCNIVLCMGCALNRIKTDETSHLITCSVCGKPFSAF